MKPVKNSEGWQRMTVQITCPWCRGKRFDDASQVRYRVKAGSFTGYCYKDRLIGKKRSDRLPRPDHPAVDWNDTEVVIVGRQRLTKVGITCPKCLKRRLASTGSTAANIRSGRLTGDCKSCSPYSKKRDWVAIGPGRKVDPNKGYVRLLIDVVPEGDRWLWRATAGTRSYLLEHRFVMAKALGRPLHHNELVDHMDGNKLNNDPANLRLYIRGKNQPGETSGYGTYYHEWQTALAEIKRLKGE